MNPGAVRFARFVAFGLLNTGLTYALFLVLQPALGHMAAYTVAYLAGIAISYLLNVRFVFRSRPSWRTAIRFPLVYLAQYLWGAAVMAVLVDLWGVRPAYAMLAVTGTSVPLTFILSRLVLAPK